MKKCESCKGTGFWLITPMIKETCPDCMGSGFDIPELQLGQSETRGDLTQPDYLIIGDIA